MAIIHIRSRSNQTPAISVMLPANFIRQDMSDSRKCVRADSAPVECEGLGPAGCFIDKDKAIVCLHGRQRHDCGMPTILSNMDQEFAARKAHDLACHSLSITSSTTRELELEPHHCGSR